MNRELMKQLPQLVWHNPLYFLAFGFGTGLSPIAPGTFGTCAAIPLYYLLKMASYPVYIGVVVLLFALGVWICQKVAHDLQVGDFSGIVFDEIVGFLITMFAAPSGWQWTLIGFLLFRLFDVWKPAFIGLIDKQVKGGLGIMLDDVAAGIVAALVLQVLAYSVGAKG